MKIEMIKQKGNNFLWIDDSLWMWDIPIENDAQQELANQAYGDVLVAGYGLGLVQRHLKNNPKVTSILTVEKHAKIVSICRKEYGKIFGSVVFYDFFEYEYPLKYDCVIGDIWADILPRELDKYKKFKEKALTCLKPNGKILGWGSDYYEYLIEKEKYK